VKCLVVHPDEVRRRDLARWLEQRGHDSVVASSAEQAEREPQRFALAVLGGYDLMHTPLARRLRHDDAVLVLLCEPRARADLEQALASGVAQVLIEPASDEQLRISLAGAEYRAAERLRHSRAIGALRQSAQRFRSLVQNALDIIAVLEPDGTVRYISPSVRRLLDYEPHDIVGAKIDTLVHRDDAAAVREALRESALPGRIAKVEARLRHRSGQWRMIEAVADNLLDYPSVRGVVVNGRDVTDRHQLEQMLARQAFYDGLTGLANRALFMDRVEHALMQHGRREGTTALLFVDLDGFKSINDAHGHDVGDAALAAAASRLLECKREGDTAARLGGDEFCILLDAIDGFEDATRVAERVLAALRRPLEVGEHLLRVTVSVGIAYADAKTVARELVRRADAAMYRAKALGKDRYAVWEPGHDEPGGRPPASGYQR
jgi:diguanylate cyclase (GGDEF)-like protein/PAS domain S-box-containing protein